MPEALAALLGDIRVRHAGVRMGQPEIRLDPPDGSFLEADRG
jgi:hypothetical protein